MADDTQLLMYRNEDGGVEVQVLLEPGQETVWLTQAQMAELFQVDRTVITKHISNIIEAGELDEEANVQRLHIKNKTVRPTKIYNLDMILAVGYRVNTHRGVQFRVWATKVLGEFIVKGYVMDNERLANGPKNYFEELLERVRSIRTSEANFYEKVKSIFSTSMDYSGGTEVAREFFATIQNKFHYAIHGRTAAELKYDRADSAKENMGLTVWKGEVITAQDAQVAKNYLTALEVKRLELLVEQFLSFAELQAVEQRPMYMSDWHRKLNQFLTLNDKQILAGKGQVSADAATDKVRAELAAYKNRLNKPIPDDSLSKEDMIKALEKVSRPLNS